LLSKIHWLIFTFDELHQSNNINLLTLCYEKCLPGDETETIGELLGRNGLCAGTLITLRASEEAAALFTASA